MMSRKYDRLEDGGRIEVQAPGQVIRLACCDCGLVHRVAVAMEDNGNIGLAFTRDKRATAQKRRYARITVERIKEEE